LFTQETPRRKLDKGGMSREIQKEDRKRRILDAAEALIRKTGTTEFSMALLAERASLSGPTPYNLFGSKGGILYALLNRSVDGLFSDIARGRGKSSDPVEMVLHAAQTAGDEFASDPRFYRPLYQFLLGIHDPVHRPAYMDRALFYWKQALLHLAEAGQLPDVIPHDQLARMMVVNTLGALDLWVQSELDDDQLRAQVLYGTAVLLYSVADATQRDHLSARLRVLERQLPKRFSAQTPEAAPITASLTAAKRRGAPASPPPPPVKPRRKATRAAV